ncbi:uncharacterized protein LOC126771887 [Nymphalis io]|uniref:uncharacterized protein LOC126771887 n=1 Tax=Inachis io TaxID=171585 RepID=UPI002168668A|nr:uncharacterized protein LOC126771887 [Nymphalis io]
MNIKSIILFFLYITPTVFCVRCYQCASSQNLIEDTCGAYKRFDTDSHIAVECGSDESHIPGSFCVKLTQQGPKGFIWDGRWRQVIRRCASVSETGVTGVCNWGVYENGVYWEECYCSSDECNSASSIYIHIALLSSAIVAVILS